MKIRHFPNSACRMLRWCLLLAVLTWSALPAAAVEERCLLIFGTSAAMKKRLPAVDKFIQQLYITDFSHQLGAGDSIGVWTYNDKLHMGEFPLIVWPPEQNKDAADKLFSFVKKQSYSGDTSFAVIQETLNRVITDSEHLTVILVMDGNEMINGTPYDDGINNLLLKTQNERRDAHQPVVLVLRTMKGKYVGSTVSFPPNLINFPAYPEVPKPAPKPIEVYTPPPEPKVIISGPPLVIVGKSVGTNLEDLVKQEQAKAAANPPPVTPAPKVTEAAPAQFQPIVVNTNSPAPVTPAAPVAPVTPAPATGASVNPPTTPPTVAAVAPAPASANPQNPQVVIIGKTNWLLPALAGALGVVVILIVVMVVLRSRQPRTSLITDSLNNPNQRPPTRPE